LLPLLFSLSPSLLSALSLQGEKGDLFLDFKGTEENCDFSPKNFDFSIKFSIGNKVISKKIRKNCLSWITFCEPRLPLENFIRKQQRRRRDLSFPLDKKLLFSIRALRVTISMVFKF